MIQLFDYYNQETQDLHDSSLQLAMTVRTIVIEANGFLLPDDRSPLYLLSGG